jgi:phosphoenolpyruvate carboxylase
MEQILGGLLAHACDPSSGPKPEWASCMAVLADAGRRAYLELIERPGFMTYFRQATPIACIEELPIGSRPSRRSGRASLEDLRAIPYTFSWTQSRQLINAFYGVGTAWIQLPAADQQRTVEMYREWPFFRSMIDNAELAMAKCDPVIARAYAEQVEDPRLGESFSSAITAEMGRTRRAILAITERPALLSETPWFQRSVEIRKPYIDVLNYCQLELMRRQKADEGPEEVIRRGLRLSVQSIAAGLRTTG